MKFLQANQDSSISVALTPLVDIIFLLIIFFLVSSTFEKGEEDLDISLPKVKGKSTQNSVSKSERWSFNIKKDGSIHLLVQKEGSSSKGMEKISLDAARHRLKANQVKSKNIKVILRADELVPYGIPAKLLGYLTQYGFSKLSLKVAEEAKSLPTEEALR